MMRLVSSTSTSRRKHLRVQPSPSKPIRVDVNGENFIDVVTAYDICESGITIEVEHGFKGCQIGLEASFIIELPAKPSNQIIRVDGVIKHTHIDRFGVEFINISDIAKEKIRRYVEGRAREDASAAKIIA